MELPPQSCLQIRGLPLFRTRHTRSAEPQCVYLCHDVAVEGDAVVGVHGLAAALLIATVHVRHPSEGRDAQGPRRSQEPILCATTNAARAEAGKGGGREGERGECNDWWSNVTVTQPIVKCDNNTKWNSTKSIVKTKNTKKRYL